ncbi:MAG: hypothetical protein EA419_06690 [Wenzhouxiangella sp.]|nr:MAG: hypothetical protein EA419_06690 [Wenzhouxiangella sp.]
MKGLATRPGSRVLSGVVIVGLALMVSACNDAPPPAEPPEPQSMPMTEPPADQPDTGPAERIAVQDLAERLEIPAETIEVRSARAVTWPDGAIGCPQPDGMYTQALVEGLQIVLAANDQEFHYHAGGGREPFLCPEERRQMPIGPGRAQPQ